jgi:uncharacterized protein (TIGR00251 family)
MPRQESHPRAKSGSSAASTPTGAAARASGNSPPPPAIREQDATLLVTVRVTPRASRNDVRLEPEALRVWLTAPPVEGAANEALVALLAERLRLPRGAVSLARGATSRVKQVAITGLTAAELLRRLGR